MDKKNTLIGLVLIVGAFGILMYEGRRYKEVDEPEEAVATRNYDNATPSLTPTSKAPEPSTRPAIDAEEDGLFKAVSTKAELPKVQEAKENIHELENEFIKVRFSSLGGGIKDVTFKEFAEKEGSEERFIFNDLSSTPLLNIGFAKAGKIKGYKPEYRLVSQSRDKILLSTKTPEGIEIYRGYSLSQNHEQQDPYNISHETRFVNKSNQAFSLERIYLNMGTLPPTRGDAMGEYLNVGYYNGKKANFLKVKGFSSSGGFLGFGKRSAREYIEEPVWPLVWASVKNQFFTSVVTPKEPAKGVYAIPEIIVTKNEDGTDNIEEGISGSVMMELGQIEPNEERLFGLNMYVGPKEFTRLQALGNNQDLVMQFGFLGIISKILLVIMKGVNSFIPNWGFTIIVVTIMIKLLLWPLTAIQVRSSKRMAKIQGPLKEVREKYKSNPQKVQMETLKLFKENKVNPAAGCLPLLVQLPIFLGLYFMLRTSSELRFAHFLWIQDLSLPDTITYISNFPINILPLIMGVSMFFQMKLTPSPMTDNTQKRIFQLMPFIFLIFCYNFPSGLVLYWTVQNLLTIVQQSITNRSKDPIEIQAQVVKPGSAKKKKRAKKG